MCEAELSRYNDVDSAPMDAGTRLVVQFQVEEAERKFHQRVLLHHVVDDEYFVLTLDNDRYNESLEEYSLLNGRDRFPDAAQGEVHAFAEPIADGEMRRMVVNTRAACAPEEESRGLQRRVSETFLEEMVTMCCCQVTNVLFPGSFAARVFAAGPPRRPIVNK